VLNDVEFISDNEGVLTNMPNQEKETIKKLVSAKKDLRESSFAENKEISVLSDKAKEVIGALQEVLDKGNSDFYTAFMENKAIAAANSLSDLYLIYYGSFIFTDCAQEIATNPKLVEEIIKVATLCFPYFPCPNKSLEYYFASRKKYLLSADKKQYWFVYFSFLKSLIAEKNINISYRFTFLASVFKFFVANKEIFADSFVNKLFYILHLSQTKELLLEYKPEIFSSAAYIPSYVILLKTQINTSGEERKSYELAYTVQKKLNKAIEEDRRFLQENNLTPISFFAMELKKFICFLPEYMDSYLSQENREAFCRNLALFMHSGHSLSRFFSTAALQERIDLFYKKNDALIETMLINGESSNAKIQKNRETERLKKEKKKKKKALKNIKQEKRKLCEKTKEKIENKFIDLTKLVSKLSKSLENAINYIKQIAEYAANANVRESIQKFKTELGKFYSELRESCDLLNLPAPTFIDIPNSFLELEAAWEKLNYANGEKNNELKKKFSEVKEILVEAEQDREKIREELNTLVKVVESLKDKISACFKMLKQGITQNKIKQFNKCKGKIDNLSEHFHYYIVALEAYQQIIPNASAPDADFDKTAKNIESLEKIFKELAEDIKEYSEYKPDQITFSPTTKNLLADRQTYYETHVDWERDLKEHFLKTWEVIHRIPYIKFEQGRGMLAFIFIRKLNGYKEKIKSKQLSLLERENSLDLLQNKPGKKAPQFVHYEYNRLNEEKTELDDLDQHITGLISILVVYGEAETEFHTMEVEYKNKFDKLFNSFKCFFCNLQDYEEKFMERKSLLDKAIFSESASNPIKKELFNIRNILQGKYRELKQLNETLKEVFIMGQQSAYHGKPFISNAIIPAPIPLVHPTVSLFFPTNVCSPPVQTLPQGAVLLQSLLRGGQ
jgi:hypothetical protein